LAIVRGLAWLVRAYPLDSIHGTPVCWLVGVWFSDAIDLPLLHALSYHDLYRALCVVVLLPQSPFTAFIDGMSLCQQFSVSFCRTTLNLFFSQRPLTPPLLAAMSCHIVSCLPSMDTRAIIIPLCTTPLLLQFFFFFLLHP